MNWCRDVEDKIGIMGFNAVAKEIFGFELDGDKKILFFLKILVGFLMQFIK